MKYNLTKIDISLGYKKKGVIFAVLNKFSIFYFLVKCTKTKWNPNPMPQPPNAIGLQRTAGE